MRLLFIYFYKEKGTFKEKTIIELSKKYKIEHNKNFNFTLIENSSFQDNFYGDNIEIGAIIGENGTGKSILINSLRDKKNDYSFTVYEKYHKLFYHGILDKKLMINNKEVHSLENISYIYYSPIIDMFNTNRSDEYNVSDKQLLLNNDNVSFLNNLFLIENNDINYYLNMKTQTMNKYVSIKTIKFEVEKDFFQKLEDILYSDIKILKVMSSLALNNHEIILEYAKEIVSKLSYNKKIELFNNIRKIENLKDILLVDTLFCQQYYDTLHTNLWSKYELEKREFNLRNMRANTGTESIINKIKDYTLNEKETILLNIDKLKELFQSWVYQILNNINVQDFKNFKNIQPISKLIEKTLRESYSDRIKEKKEKVNDIFRISEIMYLLENYTNGDSDLIDFQEFNLTIYQKELILQYHYSSMQIYIEHLTLNGRIKIVSKYFQDFQKQLLSKSELDIGLIFIYAFYKKNTNLLDKEKLQLVVYLNYLINNDSNRFDEFEIINNESFDSLEKRLIEKFKFDVNAKEVINVLKNVDNNLLLKMNIIEGNKKFFKGLELIDYKYAPFLYQLTPPLSSGQKAILFIFARIDNAIKQIESNNITILLDEADLKLHLEWQRQFINDLVEFLKSYDDKKFYILYATHSPMILSDITNDRIVFLEKKKGKDEDGKDIEYSIDKPLKKGKATFGANIYDLYHDSFFMKKYMGEFAFNKINDVINIVNLYKRIEQEESAKNCQNINMLKEFDSYKKRYGDSLDDCEKIRIKIEDDKENLERIVEKIGEPLLRNNLLREIREIGGYDEDKVINALKDMSPDKRKEKLSKYSKQRQIELLTKLLDKGK